MSALSGVLSAAASSKLNTILPNMRTIGHFVSFFVTLALMIVVIVFAVGWKCKGVKRRQRKYAGKNWFVVYGPQIITIISAPLIMADQTRHVLSDLYDLTGFGWAWCGDNNVFPRINETWSDACKWSATQYVCNEPCCVPMIEATTNGLPWEGAPSVTLTVDTGLYTDVCQCNCLEGSDEVRTLDNCLEESAAVLQTTDPLLLTSYPSPVDRT